MPSTSVPWSVSERLSDAQFKEFERAKIQHLHAQLLYSRGLHTPTEMRAFLEARLELIPSPDSLIDMKPALERIKRALHAREHITVYGDFDADGVTSAALLTRALRHLKQPEEHLSFYLPNRFQGTRGLSKDALDTLKQRGTRLIITTDCGSSDVDEVNYAREQGIEVIITDHHQPPQALPQAVALINPWRPDCTYGERYLCGVGIAFKLAQALYRDYGCEQDVWELLDLVAIGTIGDVACVLGENHTLVRAGVQRLNTTQNLGLKALIQIARLQAGRMRERDISFVLAPRINAAGRMKEADLAFRLLTTESSDEAWTLAEELEGLNSERQQQTEGLMKLVREQAKLQKANKVILVYGEKTSWPEGIIGLVAGKLSEETQRPVFVLSQDATVSRGSARSQGGFNLILALRSARSDLFERYGGHAQAAGFTIANSHIAELHEHLLHWHEQPQGIVDLGEQVPGEVVAEEADGGIGQEATPMRRMIDIQVTRPEKLNMDTLEKIRQIGPFGTGNPEPVFLLNDMQVVRHWASGAEGRHLRVRLRSNGMIFNGNLLRGGERVSTFTDGAQVQVICALEQAWSPADSEPRQEIWLKILDIIVVRDGPSRS